MMQIAIRSRCVGSNLAQLRDALAAAESGRRCVVYTRDPERDIKLLMSLRPNLQRVGQVVEVPDRGDVQFISLEDM